jgi:2-oxoglutarate/2-oxoacid ferredoxin oxidoreductase subunit alpha
MSKKVTTIKIAGPAGLGIKSAGHLFSKVLADYNFSFADYSEYPSLVRGGHNTYQITFSPQKVFAPHFNVDLFFSVLPGHWQQHQPEFNSKTLIFSDEETKEIPKKGILLNLPLKELVNKIGTPVVANTISLGVIIYLLDLDLNLVKKIVSRFFNKASDLNSSALDSGYNYAKENFSKHKIKLTFPKKDNKKETCFYDGNEAFGWGFLKGDGDFYSAYPMTPATGTLHFLAAKQEACSKLKVIHPEDEIAAASLAAGAAFTGARATTGTSGGGFALMNETISFCGVTEIATVFYLVSRPGPATGLPTWTAQADLLFALNSGHGEFPKVLLAPGDIEESFEMGYQSLNLAAQLQLPVIVLSDKFISESSISLDNLDKRKIKVEYSQIETKPSKGFKRYEFTSTGISKLSIPGTKNGQFLANSYEHDEYGFSTENADAAVKMSQKRLSKLETAKKIAPKANFFGSKSSKKLIIAWGSTKGPILEALEKLRNKDDCAFLQLKTIWPINPDIQKIINAFKEKVVIENNQTSQLVTVLKSQFEFNPTKILNKSDGRPFFPEEIVKYLESKK